MHAQKGEHAYVSIRQHTSAYVSIRQHTSAYVSIRQHTSAYVSPYVSYPCMLTFFSTMGLCPTAGILLDSTRQHTSAYVSIR